MKKYYNKPTSQYFSVETQNIMQGSLTRMDKNSWDINNSTGNVSVSGMSQQSNGNATMGSDSYRSNLWDN